MNDLWADATPSSSGDRPTGGGVVDIYTDGSCINNPGSGGWAALLCCGEHQRELSGCDTQTTNNRMELIAAIEALRALKRRCRVRLYTDSNYLKQGMNEWLPRWRRKNWRTSRKQPVLNQELWRALSDLNEQHQIEWHWVKAHAGHPENERVDALARQRALQTDATLKKGDC